MQSSTDFTFHASTPIQSRLLPNTTLYMVADLNLLAPSDALLLESIRLVLVMIDWITCQVAVSSLPETGRRIHSTKHGELILDGRLPEYLESSETKIFCIPFGDHLLISGNPTKYLQGHNVTGIDSWDVVDILVETVCCHFDIQEWEIISVSRIDITYSYLLDSDLDVELSLTELGKCTAERWGRPVIKHGTNYWGNAKRSQLKAYAKAPEFKRRNRKSLLFNQYKLPPILRFEHTLGRNHWQEHNWKILKNDNARKELWSKAMERLRINELETVDISKIPRKLQKIIGLWKAGVDLRSIYKPGTLYNYASELRQYNIDIWQEYHESNIRQFSRVIRSKPLTIQHVKALGLPVWQKPAA